MRVMVAAIGFRINRGQGFGQQQFNPGIHETEKRGHADTGGDGGYKNAKKKPPERIAVEIRGFIEFLGNARHKAFQNPHRQRNVEQAVGQGHRYMGIKKADG